MILLAFFDWRQHSRGLLRGPLQEVKAMKTNRVELSSIAYTSKALGLVPEPSCSF